MTAPRNATSGLKGRTYRWKGETFASVTSLLGSGVPKPALTNWAAKSVAEYVADNIDQVNALARKDPAACVDLCKGSPWRQRDKAADAGTALHEAAEAVVLGTPIPEATGVVADMLTVFRQFLDDWRPVYEMAEATVYSRRWSFAGTLDAIFTIDGKRYICDTKTGKGIYPEVGLQLAAYSHAEFIGMPDDSEVPMPSVDGALALHIRPEGYRLIPVEAGEAEFKAFLYASEVARWCWDNSHVVGAAMTPPEYVAEGAFPIGDGRFVDSNGNPVDRNARPIAPANVDALVGEP